MAVTNTMIMFGGDSAEHEVSIITGLQVVEKIDRQKFNPFVLYLTRDGQFHYYPELKKRQDFKRIKPQVATLGRDDKGSFFQIQGMLGKKVYADLAYLAFHGGTGESGPAQGMLELLGIGFTSTGQEGAVITMNKALTKQVLEAQGLPTIPGLNLTVHNKQVDPSQIDYVKKTLAFPLIVKPVHLGSSIGINVARTEVELEKYLAAAALIDSEIVVEKFMTSFVEYNCSVRKINGKIETSEIEKPKGSDEILSFADKYQRGGGKKSGGMANLTRELPANISSELTQQIKDTAIKIFQACRCTGMVRIDFMHTAESELFITEVNPIPGSMAFYLWEAAGISFTQQITDLLEQAARDRDLRISRRLVYSTDIVEKFVAQ